MSGFELVPVDGGKPIHLPPGDTVVGRGPLLGVSDKRVSRHHGLLENLNGQLRLKSTHLNPCFVQSSLTDDPRPLQKDTWLPLGDGDLFSLLPGQFIYRVVAVGGEEGTPRNSQMFEEEEEEDESLVPPNADKEPAPSPIGQEHGQAPSHKDATQAALSDEANIRLHQAASVFLKDEEAQASVTPPAVYRKRILPAWMMAVTSNGRSSSPKAVKRSKGPVSSSAPTQRPAVKQTTPPLTTSPKGVGLHEEEKEEEEKRPKKRWRKMSDEELQATTDFEVVRDDFPMEEEEEGEDGGQTSTADRNTTNKEKKPENKAEMSQRAKPVGSNSSSASSTGSTNRTPCPYGTDCYRKNPIHFQECSHPGDPDYKEEEEDEDADRPECPYGTDCYRKNPLHRKEYKHTKRPARTSRTVTQKPQADDDDEDEDDEYDNSFINDDSEDLGDDSDYVPPDSDDSGKEDVKRLQKEAKVFLKRRK